MLLPQGSYLGKDGAPLPWSTTPGPTCMQWRKAGTGSVLPSAEFKTLCQPPDFSHFPQGLSSVSHVIGQCQGCRDTM